MFNFLNNIGPTELIIVGLVLIIFFGSKKMAELGKAGGETVKEIKKIKKDYSGALKEVNKDIDDDEEEYKNEGGGEG